MYAVIMAGGGGTRLHPLSRPERPKPFLPLLPSGETLLQATARRLPVAPDAITVVTERRYERFVRDQLPDAHVLLEPMGRNTAAAIALGAIAIDKPADEVMLVVPADAYIEPKSERRYTSVLEKAGRLATDAFEIDGPLVTFGVQATRPATEYGYLIPKLDTKRDVDGLVAYELDRFEEKPTQERAQMLLKEPGSRGMRGSSSGAAAPSPPRSGDSPVFCRPCARWSARRCCSSPRTRRSSRPARSTMRSWRVRRETARS